MAREGLFEDLPERPSGKASVAGGAPRLRQPERDQIELRPTDLDSVIGSDHPARQVWAYVERLNLSALYARIGSREGTPGHPAIDPKLMLALWLFATSQGVGSARALARLCECHDAYRWLCGGVSVNYHTLADFRVEHADVLDELLKENVAALAAAGVIDLGTLAQDGLRVRASAGAGSFRRGATLRRLARDVAALVERLKGEVDDDPDASNRRIKAARERAAAAREARVQAALERLRVLKEQRERRKKSNAKQTAKQSEPRASTTDAEARVMKMADGGFRPAYNLQIASVPEQQIAVAVAVETSGSDRGQMRPMLEQIAAGYGRYPERYLVDGGFAKNADIEYAGQAGVTVYAPAGATRHGSDPYAPKPEDGPGVAQWRERMKSAAGKTVYRRRSVIECLNARLRHWRLDRLTVRGPEKARAVLLWHALANNILRGHKLLAAAQG